MNKISALLCITLYTLLIFVGSTSIIKVASKEKQFDNYGEAAENEDLYINVQVIEDRSSKLENSNEHDKANYNVSFVVTKKNIKDDISNLYAYVCAEDGDDYSYVQTSYGTSISAKYTTYTYYRSTTMSLLNSSTEFAYKKYTTTDNVTKLVDKTPDTFYVRLSYNIVKENSSTTESKEFTYKFDYTNDSYKSFKNFEQWTTTAGVLTAEDSPFLIEAVYSPNYTTSNDQNKDKYQIATFDIKDSFVPEGETVKSMSMKVYAEIGNTDLIDAKFSNYVKLFDYEGSFNLNKPREAIDCSRTTYLLSDYNVEKLYFVVDMELSNGTTYSAKFYTTVKGLPTA